MPALNLFVLFVNIQLYERGDYDDAVIGIYCGTTPPPTITTTSNVLVVKFITDLGIVHEGFNASYTRLYGKKKSTSGVDPKGDRGFVPHPSQNHNNICFLNKTSPDRLKNHKATKPEFNIGPSPVQLETLFKLRFAGADDGPLKVVFRSSLLPSSTKKK